MGLDVYVGSLTRYLSGDWETVVQLWARESGTHLETVRAHNPTDAITDPEVIMPAVLAWRSSLGEGMRRAGLPTPDWDERPDAPYFTDKPGWGPYGDLVRWASHEQLGKTPPINSLDEWFKDPAVLEAKTRKTDYPTIVRGVEVWLPVDFAGTFEAQWITGDVLTFGSVQQLLRELGMLNERAWNGTGDELASWRKANKAKNEPLEVGARFACALFMAMATKAQAHCLVTKLDY